MKTRSPSILANLYNPHEQSEEELINSFVVRQEVFQQLFQDIKSPDPSKPGQHYLIEGQRGMGKTTLLLRLSYEIEHDRELQHGIVPIVLKEEAYYGIQYLFELWEAVVRELEARYDFFSGLSEDMRKAYKHQNATLFDNTEYAQLCFDMVVHALKNRAKKLILFIDNCGELFQNFSKKENLCFRDALSDCPYIQLIAATPVVFEALQKEFLVYVFSNFFTTISLEGLNKEETHSLLLELGKASKKERRIRKIIAHHPGRIESLRILTGGVPRTLILLFEIFAGNHNGNSLTYLNTILDRVTPLYQNRMQELSPPQRHVVNAIALNWDAISPGEIAQQTHMSREDVVSILRELEKVLVVQYVIAENFQYLYRLRERFFNIWYLMRLAPGGSRNRVLWLLHFLENWYDQHEFHRHAQKYTKAIVAKHHASQSSEPLIQAFIETIPLNGGPTKPHIIRNSGVLRRQDSTLAADAPLFDQELLEKAEAAYQKAHYQEAVDLFKRLNRKNAHIDFRIGYALSHLEKYQEAILYLARAAEEGYVKAMLHLGYMYHQKIKHHNKARTYYTRAAEKGDMDAMLLLGKLYHYDLHTPQHAEKYYLMAVHEGRKRLKIGTSRSLDAIRSAYVEAMFQLGNLYSQDLQNYQDAQTYYLAAIKAGSADAAAQLGLFCHYTLKKYKSAVKYYALAIKMGEHEYAAMNLALLYHNELKDPVKAERCYLSAIKTGNTAAMNGLAWLYFEQKSRKPAALRYARRAFEQEKNMYTAHTLACIYLWNDQPEEAVQIAREFMYKEEAYSSLHEDIFLYLMLLIAKQHYRYLSDYFKAPELLLHERFKLVYYAFLYYMHDPDYYKRPPELVEPLRGIIGQVRRLASGYA